jgi:hypothetical protein
VARAVVHRWPGQRHHVGGIEELTLDYAASTSSSSASTEERMLDGDDALRKCETELLAWPS